MKKIVFILTLFFGVVCVSCSSGYSQSKADDLVEKINSGEELSQAEVGDAIKLAIAGDQKLVDWIEKTKNMSDEEKEKLENDTEMENEFKSLFTSLFTINSYLKSHRSDFNEANTEAYEKLKEKEVELGKVMLGN